MKIIDFEFEKLSRQEKELEKLRKNSNVKKLLVDYQVSDDCINSDSYGAVCVKCGRCGRTFTKDGFLKEMKIMKKGTTVESGYDAEGRWHLKIKKAKGKFTLDEIIEAAKEWEEDYYAVIIKAMGDETAQYYDDDLEGDYVTLYRATDFISKEA